MRLIFLHWILVFWVNISWFVESQPVTCSSSRCSDWQEGTCQTETGSVGLIRLTGLQKTVYAFRNYSAIKTAIIASKRDNNVRGDLNLLWIRRGEKSFCRRQAIPYLPLLSPGECSLKEWSESKAALTATWIWIKNSFKRAARQASVNYWHLKSRARSLCHFQRIFVNHGRREYGRLSRNKCKEYWIMLCKIKSIIKKKSFL